jgi:hypothetical protein
MRSLGLAVGFCTGVVACAIAPPAASDRGGQGASTATGKPSGRLLGAWELIAVTPVSLQDSMPRGIPNRTEIYTADGRMCVVGPEESKIADEECVKYSEVAGERRLTLADGEALKTLFSLEGSDRLLLHHSSEEVWTYRRLAWSGGALEPREPTSVEFLRQGSSGETTSAASGGVAPSDSGPRSFPLGLWEVNGYRNVPARELPPYGFLNEKYWIEAGRFCVLRPWEAAPRAEACSAAEVSREVVAGLDPTRGEVVRWRVTSNRWGHLVLSGPVGEMSLRPIVGSLEKMPVLQPKIVLLSPASRAAN